MMFSFFAIIPFFVVLYFLFYCENVIHRLTNRIANDIIYTYTKVLERTGIKI